MHHRNGLAENSTQLDRFLWKEQWQLNDNIHVPANQL